MLQIVEYPDPILNRVCQPVGEFDEALAELVKQMITTMYLHDGVGLAAPQVGVLKRIVVVDPSGGSEADQLEALVNPVVTWSSAEHDLGDEGCLSVQGETIRVSRARTVIVESCDLTGRPVVVRYDGFKARVVQHEIDHLDGVTIVDKEGPLAKKLVLQNIAKRKRTHGVDKG